MTSEATYDHKFELLDYVPVSLWPLIVITKCRDSHLHPLLRQIVRWTCRSAVAPLIKISQELVLTNAISGIFQGTQTGGSHGNGIRPAQHQEVGREQAQKRELN